MESFLLFLRGLVPMNHQVRHPPKWLWTHQRTDSLKWRQIIEYIRSEYLLYSILWFYILFKPSPVQSTSSYFDQPALTLHNSYSFNESKEKENCDEQFRCIGCEWYNSILNLSFILSTLVMVENIHGKVGKHRDGMVSCSDTHKWVC